MRYDLTEPQQEITPEWSSPQTYSDRQKPKLYLFILSVIAFSIPLETLLPHYFGMRSHIFYLSALGMALAVLVIPTLLRKFFSASGLLLITVAFVWTITIYFVYPVRTNNEYELVVQLILSGVMFIYVADDVSYRDRFIKLYWGGWFILCVLSLQQYLSGQAEVATLRVLDIERVMGILSFSPAQHGAQVAAGLCVAIILTMRQPRGWGKAFMFGSVLLGSTVVLMTSSRTAVVSLVLTMLLYVFVEFGQNKSEFIRSNMTLLVVMVFGSLLVLTQTSFLDSFLVRITRTFTEGDTTGRTELAQAALELYKQNPILGIGQGNSIAAIGPYLLYHPEGVDLHNYYLKMLVEGGIISFPALMLGLLLVIRRGWKWYRCSGEAVYFFPLILLLIISLGGRTFHYKVLWFFLVFTALTPPMNKIETPAANGTATKTARLLT